MIFFTRTSPDISQVELGEGLSEALQKLGSRSKVLILPPDITRFHSRAGDLTRFAWEHYGEAVDTIMPALGTHAPMTEEELSEMYSGIPQQLFKDHNWRRDVVTLGEVPAEFVEKVSDGAVNYPWPAQVNRQLVEGSHDLILSIGQVVPHEVAGMANYNKNIFVGTGGAEGINKSHFLGAACDMEKIMGRADNPVRRVLNYASDNFAASLPQIVYVLTVMAQDQDGQLRCKGLFIGDDIECFYHASELAAEVNITWLDKPIKKAVVYLDPGEYKSTWLGNKAIYRTRKALADQAELMVIAPGVETFGEDAEIDKLIRKYGYRGTEQTLKNVEGNKDLAGNLSAAAHLIHGSSEGRFTITYCPGKLTQKEIENVNFEFAPLADIQQKYDPEKLHRGFNKMADGEEVYFISNPGLGLWSCS
ncbi:MAG: lactate racemase domain-containing protein [Lentisphaeria bacterium]